ncbi:hypothetical protein IBD94_09605, partial [Francisella tularensis]|nr:hypothetical protein [Francisella tularensis]
GISLRFASSIVLNTPVSKPSRVDSQIKSMTSQAGIVMSTGAVTAK